MTPAPRGAEAAWRPADGLAYGLLGLPLAFVALPLYVHLPHRYAQDFGLSLAVLGLVLLAARLLDAVIDPLLGRWVDALYARSHTRVWAVSAAAGCGLVLGLVLLFLPPMAWRASATTLLAGLSGALLLTYACFSVLTIAHQAWGTRVGGDAAQRSRVVAWREGCGVVGVVLASLLPGLAGWSAMLTVFALTVALGLWAWRHSPLPAPAGPHAVAPGASLLHPWRVAPFRRLLAVFALNGIASAVSATLVLFFIHDRLGAAPAQEPLFLGLYFVAAAASLPLWLAAVRRWGLARSWLAGMGLAIGAFVSAAALGPGDTAAFFAICLGSGLALGADVVLPGAMLTGVIDAQGDRGRHDGAYLGWWNFVTKLNLALAAGAALPLLAWLGYTPGTQEAQGLRALSMVYALLPCTLKALAGGLLWWTFIRRQSSSREILA